MPNGSKKVTLRENRYFVIDTNVLLHDSKSIYAFRGVVLAVPFVVLEELDHFKKEIGEIGRNAREAIRILDELRVRGCLSDGVPVNGDPNGSRLRVVPVPAESDDINIIPDTVDNKIILTVRHLMKQGYEVTFVSKDINARIKADALGIDVEDYVKGVVEEETFYKGWQRVELGANLLRSLGPSRLPELTKDLELETNEFVITSAENNPENSRVFRHLGGRNFKEVLHPPFKWNFVAKNMEQLMALDLLMDDDIKLLSLIGPAGTGKTFLTLLAGLEKVANTKMYSKFLITRPIVALGADIGYLPGDVQEKLHNWMMPIRDNLEFIFSKEYIEEPAKPHDKKRKKHPAKPKPKPKHKNGSDHNEIDHLQDKGILSIEAITYMRGRSIPNQFIFIDEVQNLTPHEVKTIVSRAGEGSKVVIAGDPYQIDSPYLNFTSNGLTVTTEKLKGQGIFGTSFLEHSERSELAQLAVEVL